MRAKHLLGVVVIALAIPTPAVASPADWLKGRWSGEGHVLGAPSSATLTVEPVLDGRFIELRYVTMRGAVAAKRTRFEGRAMYRIGPDGRWTGSWFDSTGAVRPLIATPAADELNVDWGDTATERGRTLYRLTAKGALEIIDSVQRKDGAWHEFGRQTLRRRPFSLTRTICKDNLTSPVAASCQRA